MRPREPRLALVVPMALMTLMGLATLAAAPAASCDLAPDPRPHAQRLADEPLAFVGTVSAVSGRQVSFAVHHTIQGMPGEAVDVQALPPSSCAISFAVGQRWLYAGAAVHQPSVLLLADARGVPPDDFGRMRRVDDLRARWPVAWQACTHNTQCRTVAIGCDQGAVNAGHAVQAAAQSIRLLGDPRAMNCASRPAEAVPLPAPQCVASRCGQWVLDLRRP